MIQNLKILLFNMLGVLSGMVINSVLKADYKNAYSFLLWSAYENLQITSIATLNLIFFFLHFEELQRAKVLNTCKLRLYSDLTHLLDMSPYTRIYFSIWGRGRLWKVVRDVKLQCQTALISRRVMVSPH